MSEQTTKQPNVYRIVEFAGGFEVQIQFHVRGRDRWFALNADGFWADPDEWNDDDSSTRYIVASRSKAERILIRAKTINQENIRRAT